MRQKLILTRGLPGSGKSTLAKQLVDESNGRLVRIERDLLRDQLYNSRMYVAPEGSSPEEIEAVKAYVAERENTITTVQFSAAEGALRAGKDVIISDTNLRAKYVKDWMAFARKWSVDFETMVFDNVSVDECVRRDKLRENSIGEKIIRDMAKRFLVNGKIPDVVASDRNYSIVMKVEPYDNPTDLPRAVIVDIDGTLAKMNDRSPYDWQRVGEDEPVQAVINAVNAAYQAGDHIIVMSGRDGSCREITDQWVWDHTGINPAFYDLFMRAQGDNRADNIVKYELFNENIRGKFHVNYVLDDRDQVVKMWRELGLACFQVAPGAF